MNNADTQYLDLCRKILAEGQTKSDRTGTGVISYFGHQFRFNLAEGFPLLTTKRLPFRIITEELLWFLRGETNIKSLLDKGVNIWNADAYRDFSEKSATKGIEVPFDQTEFIRRAKRQGYDLGKIYGKNWRAWEHKELRHNHEGHVVRQTDQIAELIQGIRNNPNSRRHVLSAWNVGALDEGALPACHSFVVFNVTSDKLNCHMTQRSADTFLGLPFNIASYALLTHMIAKITGLDVGSLSITVVDAHIYTNHITQIETQLKREPKELPELSIKRKVSDPAEYVYEDFELSGYDPHPSIKGEVSVG